MCSMSLGRKENTSSPRSALNSPFRRQAPSRRIALTTHGKDT